MNALLREARGRGESKSPSGYTRILGNNDLGNLISKLQATVISAGSELEKLIWERCSKINNLDDYLKNTPYPPGIYVASKKQIKTSLVAQSSFEPDFVAFQRTEDNQQNCYVIEVKDGDQFDTKKSAGEKKHLYDYLNFISQKIQFTVKPIICSFNAIDKQQVITGFKNIISKDEAYTGKELCELLNIDYSEIIDARKYHQRENMHFFIEALLQINEVRELILEQLRNQD